jgi:hypothetical protein
MVQCNRRNLQGLIAGLIAAMVQCSYLVAADRAAPGANGRIHADTIAAGWVDAPLTLIVTTATGVLVFDRAVARYAVERANTVPMRPPARIAGATRHAEKRTAPIGPPRP